MEKSLEHFLEDTRQQFIRENILSDDFFDFMQNNTQLKSTHRTDQIVPFSEPYFRTLPLPWVGGWVGEKHIPDFRTK